MQVRERQRREKGPVPSAVEPRRTSIARRGATGLIAATAGAVSVLLVVTMFVTSRGGSAARSTLQPSVATTAGASEIEGFELTQLERAVRWIDGLAAGLILPSEVTSRLAAQDPGVADIVEAAWSDLSPSAPSKLRRAVRWIDGLAAGLILPPEVSSRLALQEPGLAKTVMAAWSDLNPVTDRGSDWR